MRIGMVVMALLPAIVAAPAAAQEGSAGPVAARDTAVVPLSLDDALSRALGQSEEIRLARSQVDLAKAQVKSARAAALPQISANFGFTKTLASAFDTGGSFTLPDSLRFNPDPDAPLAERVRYLERNTPLAAFQALGGLFGNLPFGQANVYNMGVSGSQTLYSGGRTGAAMAIARDYNGAAALDLVEQTADLELQVRTAYYQALLAQRLEQIAQEALTQAERFASQQKLRLDAGRASELDVMRAEVDRDNLRPQLVQAQNGAQLALLNLKRLVNVPLAQPIELTTELQAPGPVTDAPAADAVENRAAVQAAEQQVAIRQEQVKVAKGAFLPSLSLSMNYGRQLYPNDLLSFQGDWRTDWTVSLGMQIPVFSGLRRQADLQQAKVQMEQSQLQLQQLRESVQLEHEQALGERERARSAIDARQHTADAAQRVYDLTVLRFDQGLATQLEVNDARLSLLQARTNLAQAITDYYVADATLARSLAGTGAR